MVCRYFVFVFLLSLIRYPVSAQASISSFRYVNRDSAVTHASDRYEAHSFLRPIFLGTNYRREWQQPVTLPVFRLSETGFKITDLGGGKQTKSLKLEDSAGKAWALRTIDKDVAGAIPYWLKGSFARQLKQDQISSSMPYGSLVIGPLARKAGITAAEPTIYHVADDTALGDYRALFANTVCMLEERDPGFDSTITTVDMLRRVQNDNHSLVDQKGWLRARLLDMLVADWDRHYDNWRWGQRDSGSFRLFEPVPRDRDWAFYYSNGLLPKLMRLTTDRFLINFTGKVKYIKSLNAKAHLLDAAFLNSLDAAAWNACISELQLTLTDEAIEQAVQNLPPAIYALDGAAFIQKLKSRRDGLQKPVMKYYRLHAKEVQVDGSSEAEVFSLLPSEDGFLLQVFSRKGANGQLEKIYERRFLRSETYRVTLNGLAGDDEFVLDENVHTKIKVRINGGSGNNRYRLQGQAPVKVYDDAGASNQNTR